MVEPTEWDVVDESVGSLPASEPPEADAPHRDTQEPARGARLARLVHWLTRLGSNRRAAFRTTARATRHRSHAHL